MALAVSSTSSAVMVSATSVTVTKPTGLAVGDLMVAIIHSQGTSSANIQLPVGWTNIVHQSGSIGVELRAMYKIATSGDVIASNFLFNGTVNSSYMSGSIARCTNSASISTVGATTDAYGIASGGGTLISDTCTVTPLTPNSIVFMAFAGFQTSIGVTTSGYSTSNSLSFTEFMDTSGSNRNSAAAYAVQSDTTTITTYGATLSALQDDNGAIIFTVTNPIDETGTNALHSVSPTQFSQAGVAGTTGTNTLHAVSPTMFAQSGNGQRGTPWTNPNKPATNWNNLAK